MKPPEDLVGRLVAIQFARPLMMFEYGAHVRSPGSSDERLLGRPITRLDPSDVEVARLEGRPARQVAVTTDFMMGVTLKAVGEDWLRVEVVDPSKDPRFGNRAWHTIPSALVMQIVEITGFDVEMPDVTTQTRAASKIIV